MLVYQLIKFVIKRGEHTVHIMRVIYEEYIPVHIRKIIIKPSLEKFEKSLSLRFFVLVLSRADFKIQNCKK